MIEIEEEQNQKIKALLIGQPAVPLAELEGLCKTLGIETVRSVNLTRYEPSPAYGIGSGKAQELCALAKELKADAIIFDYILEPRKQRNWEKLSKLIHYRGLPTCTATLQDKEAEITVQKAAAKPSSSSINGRFATRLRL